jgi:hypothetical protein
MGQEAGGMHKLGLVAGWVAVMMACKAPPEAPTELNELTRYLYREWEAEDPEVIAVGLRNLETFLADVDVHSSQLLERSWEVLPLQEEDVAGLVRPEGRALEDLIGVSVAYGSVWPIEDHARVQTEADQTPFEPTAPEHYDRTFVEPEDPSCFLDAGCEFLRTFNDATRKNTLLTVTFELFKDFRWVELEPGRQAFVSRSWFERSWHGENENTTLWQSHSTDLWIDQGDGTALRFQVLWSESDVGLSESDALVAGTVKFGTNEIFEHTDEMIGELYHPEADQ